VSPHLSAIIRAWAPKLTEAELAAGLAYFQPLAPARHELLVSPGQVAERMYFVLQGCLRIFFIQDSGQEATRLLAFEHQFATALVSFITHTPSLEYIQALEDTQLLCISRTDFYHLLETVPAWEPFYRCYLERAYVLNTTRLHSFLTLDARTRYQQLLAQSPVVVQRLPNKLVASYLHLSQETLSRLKSKR
jgi:CRP-like cAMP-binding protein